jgi:HrpA-like RNA helicase
MSSSKRKRVDLTSGDAKDEGKGEKREKQSQWDKTAAPTPTPTGSSDSKTDITPTGAIPASALANRLNLDKNPLNGRAWSPNYYKLLETRKGLPVYAQRDEFTAKLKSAQAMILVGETGSGKTTQVGHLIGRVAYLLSYHHHYMMDMIQILFLSFPTIPFFGRCWDTLLSSLFHPYM